ncbi:MAG: ABC transporter substrate-binding protein [Roseburia sp.]
MKKKFLKITALLMMVAMVLSTMAGCGDTSDSNANETIDLNSMSADEIVKKAKEDGTVNSVGMPNDWANWGDTWTVLNQQYGLKHTDIDVSSAEQLSIFQAEKKNATKDLGDVGVSYARLAEEKGLTLKYKTSYWDSIPDWAKDDDGDWIVGYTGTIAMLINKNLVPNAPKSFADLLEGDYIVSVGDVAKGTKEQCTILAVARALGGDESNIDPALAFFKKLAEQGRLYQGEANFSPVEKGEIGVAFVWDFVGMGYKDALEKNNPNADFEVVVPRECSVQAGYSTIINAYTQRPYAAALAREYILSDEGQLNFVKGHARPVRDIEIPKEYQGYLAEINNDTQIYQIEDENAWSKTLETIGMRWQEEVMAYVK